MFLSSRHLLAVVGLYATAALASAQVVTGPVVNAAPVLVEEPRLTESPATVTRVDLDSLPLNELNTAEFAARTANFYIATNNARSFTDTFALRGLTNTPLFGDPAVTFYLDDLPLGSGFTFPTDLLGFAQGELHRGPSQNTVFGRAGSAGVVTFTTPDPAAGPGGEVRASFGNYDARSVAATESTAMADHVDAYASFGYSSRDGYITNTRLNRDIDGQEAFSAVARARYRPTDTMEFSLLFTGLRARDGVQPLVPLGGPMFTVNRSAEGVTDVNAYNGDLQAAFNTPIGRLTATTSLNDWALGPYSDVLAFGPAELDNAVTQKQHLWNEELKLVADPASRVRWQSGAFFSTGYTDGAFTRAFGPFPYEQSDYHIESHDLAAYGEAVWSVGPALTLTAGLRAEDARKTMVRHEQVPTTQVNDLERESSALLPKFAASYALDRNTSVFATLGSGFKPGGFSAFTGNVALMPFGPERTKTVEAGVTRTSADKSLSTTVRVFWYDITGYQIERSFATGAATSDYLDVNAPRARSFGSELELNWKPLAGLTVGADLGYADVTLLEFRDPFTNVSYAGKRAPYVPVYDGSAHVEYRHASGWFASAQVTSNGKTFYTESEDPTFAQTAYALLGVDLGYATGPYRITFYGENLTNRQYYSAITPGTNHGTPGAPRTWGAEVAMTW
jgi:iron complex outermembrane receptor protein